MTMVGPESELYGVEWHSGVAQQWRPAPGRPGLALGAFGGPPWSRLQLLHLACLNGSQGIFGRLARYIVVPRCKCML